MKTLSDQEIRRYTRHISINDFGLQGQEKLKKSSVLVVGCGGLGCPALQYLAAAGVGRIGIVDFDTVSESNLQRQILFTKEDVGKLKVFVAKDRLQKLNEFVEIETFSFKLDSNNAHTLMSTFDVIVDGTDDLVTKYLMNDVCVKLNKAFVYASVFQFQGYLSVFNYRNGPHLRHVYPQCPPSSLVQNCSAAGVLGVLPGILGVLQANEVIKILTGIGSVLSGKFLVFDSLRLKFDFFDIEYLNVIPAFSMKCMSVGPEEVEMALVAEISVQEFKKMIDKKEKFQLIDVREQFEYDIVNLGGKLLPLSEIEKDPQILKENISSNIPVIVHCRSGGRSGHVCQILQEKFQYNNVFNLAGGVLAYAEHIDPTLPRY